MVAWKTMLECYSNYWQQIRLVSFFTRWNYSSFTKWKAWKLYLFSQTNGSFKPSKDGIFSFKYSSTSFLLFFLLAVPLNSYHCLEPWQPVLDSFLDFRTRYVSSLNYFFNVCCLPRHVLYKILKLSWYALKWLWY